MPSGPGSTPMPEAASELAACRDEVESLRSELDETNRGVVALYAELDAQAVQLRQATELKSRFLSYMSHEFRTPINAMRSITQLLLSEVDGTLSDEQRRQVLFVQSNAAEFAEMVDDLLDFAKVEAGRVDISPGWFEMVDLFLALRGMFKPILINPDVMLVFEEPLGVPKLFTDDRMLSQILRNFISNALKFTPKGEVRISVTHATEGFVTFSVADTGMGIAADHHGAIFRDFSQVDSPIQKRLRGTGLGLSLSKRLAELLGGKVFFTSEPGVGSIFSVSIPANLEEAAQEGRAVAR